VEFSAIADGPGAVLEDVTVQNNGTLKVGNASNLEFVGNVTLQGGGHVAMSTGSRIFDDIALGLGASLDNIDNVISGLGTIGNDVDLVLTNEINGQIAATNGMLTIKAGSAITNWGLLKASAGSTLIVGDDVLGTGTEIIADSGNMEFDSSVSSGQTVTFTGAGILTLRAPSNFFGRIAGAAANDVLDLSGYDPNTTTAIA